MRLYKIDYYVHSRIYSCYVVANNPKVAEELVLEKYKAEYNSVFIVVKRIECIASTCNDKPIEDLILESEVQNDN